MIFSKGINSILMVTHPEKIKFLTFIYIGYGISIDVLGLIPILYEVAHNSKIH
jgi:hypothetical protein